MAVSAVENGSISIQIIGAEDRNWASRLHQIGPSSRSIWSSLPAPFRLVLPAKIEKPKSKMVLLPPNTTTNFSNMSHNHVEAQILFFPITKDKLINSHSLFSSHVTNMTTSVSLSPYFKMQPIIFT